MKISYYFIICLSIFVQSCTEQDRPATTLYSKEFNWKITIPENFDSLSAGQWTKLQRRGAAAIEKTYGEKIDNKTRIIFVFRSDQTNYFESNYQPFDTAIDGNFLESCRNVNEVISQTFTTQIDGIIIDSLSSTEKIDNLEFQVFKVKLTYPNKNIMHWSMYSRLFDKKQFSVNIIYTDLKKGELMLDAWKKSRFERKI